MDNDIKNIGDENGRVVMVGDDDIYEEEYFICPYCRKSFPVNEAVIREREGKKQRVGRHREGKLIVTEYETPIYRIRHCKSCIEKKEKSEKHNKKSCCVLTLIPLVIFFIAAAYYIYLNWSILINRGIGSLIAAIFLVFFIAGIFSFIGLVIMGASMSDEKIDINQALQDNSIEIPRNKFSRW